MKKVIRKHGSESTKVEIRGRKGVLLKKQDRVKKIAAPTPAEGEAIVMVRDAAGIRLSLDYNSVMVECGIEMPFSIEPGDLEAAKAAMQQVEDLVNERLESKSAEAQDLLKSLAKKNRGH